MSRRPSVLDVLAEIELEQPVPSTGDVRDSIKHALKRNAALDAGNLHVSTSNGSVTIKGTVQSWAKYDEALDAAWAAPGVFTVDDEMAVSNYEAVSATRPMTSAASRSFPTIHVGWQRPTSTVTRMAGARPYSHERAHTR